VAVFLRDPTYPEREGDYRAFQQELIRSLRDAFPDVEIVEADAGPSASIPGWMVTLGATGWFIFSAPSTINDNLPIWKSHFERLTEIAKDLGSQLSIDVHDAAAISIEAVTVAYGWNPNSIEIVDIHAHCQNLNGVWASSFEIAELTTGQHSPQLHADAIRQYDCRYFLLIRYECDAVSVIVRADGSIEKIMRLGWR